MIGKRLLAGVVTAAFGISIAGIISASAVTTDKMLVVYFSTPEITDATTTASRVTVNGQTYGTTEYMATVIHENTDSNIFKIGLAEPYGSDVPDRALNEQQNGILPELSSHIENFDQYDTIFVGYPTWWYDMPQVMYSFFDEYDFSGKTVIPFNSHGGSGFSGSVQKIAELEPNATVRTDGLTISRGSVATSEDTIVNWLDKLNLKFVRSIPGDADQDGRLNVRDAAFIARKLAERKSDELPETADFNEDGIVNIRDAAAIAIYLAKQKQN